MKSFHPVGTRVILDYNYFTDHKFFKYIIDDDNLSGTVVEWVAPSTGHAPDNVSCIKLDRPLKFKPNDIEHITDIHIYYATPDQIIYYKLPSRIK